MKVEYHEIANQDNADLDKEEIKTCNNVDSKYLATTKPLTISLKRCKNLMEIGSESDQQCHRDLTCKTVCPLACMTGTWTWTTCPAGVAVGWAGCAATGAAAAWRATWPFGSITCYKQE